MNIYKVLLVFLCAFSFLSVKAAFAYDQNDGSYRVPQGFCSIRFQSLYAEPSNSIETILEGLVGVLNKEAFFHEWKQMNVGTDPSADAVDVLMQQLEMLAEIDKIPATNYNAISFQDAVIFLTLDSIIVKDIEAAHDLNPDILRDAQHFLNCFVTFRLEDSDRHDLRFQSIFIEFNFEKNEAILTRKSFYFVFPFEFKDFQYVIKDPETGNEMVFSNEDPYMDSFPNRFYGFPEVFRSEKNEKFLQTLFTTNGEIIIFPNPSANVCRRSLSSPYYYERRERLPQKYCVSPDLLKSSALRSLQERINEMEWSVPQSVLAAEVSDYNPVNKEALERWVNAHEEGPARQIAKQMADGLVYVTFDDFKKALIHVVEDFNNTLASLPEEDHGYVILRDKIHRGKSDEWVAALALPYLKALPSDVVVDDHLSVNYLKAHPSIRRFVILDDGTYSGKQLAERIKMLQGVCMALNRQRVDEGKALNSYSLDVIIPFMNIDPTEFLLFPDDGAQLTITTHVFRKEFTIGDILGSPENRRLANAMWPGIGTFGAGALSQSSWLIFQHKVADSVSLPYEIINKGLVGKTRYDMAKELIPEIRKELASSRSINFDIYPLKKYTGSFIDTSVIPPYKKE